MFRQLLMLVSLILLTSTAFSAKPSVEVFTQYDTHIKINDDDTFQVNKLIALRNVHQVGIIPGQIEFKIASNFDNEQSKILDYSAYNRYGEEINTNLRETQEYSVIQMDILTPILPGFEYIINLSYTMEYESSGVLFDTLKVPLKEVTRIPIKEGQVLIEIPQGTHFTYVENKKNHSIEDNKLTVLINENSNPTIDIEYSSIPFVVSDWRGSTVFLSLVNIVLLIMLIISIRKEIQKRK